MKLPLLLSLSLLLASCATSSTSSPTSSAKGIEKYRYVNTLDFGKDNTLDAIKVIGYDEANVGEVTRLDVSVGNASISLKDTEGEGNAMYNPSVGVEPDGALVVNWGQIGDTTCRSEIVANTSGKLVERKRSQTTPE